MKNVLKCVKVPAEMRESESELKVSIIKRLKFISSAWLFLRNFYWWRIPSWYTGKPTEIEQLCSCSLHMWNEQHRRKWSYVYRLSSIIFRRTAKQQWNLLKLWEVHFSQWVRTIKNAYFNKFTSDEDWFIFHYTSLVISNTTVNW